MTFADDSYLRSRFVSAVKKTGGTLALSWINLGEFAEVQDAAHAKNAEGLISELIPQIFFLEPNPFEVRDRENRILERREVLAPHGDTELLKSFLGRDGSSVNPLSAVDLISAVKFCDLTRSRAELASTIVAQVAAMHAQYETDETYRRSVDRLSKGKPIQRGTRFVFREILSLITRNNHVFNRNDAMDLLHAVVPLAYCDFVLLDKHWEALANQAKSRLARCGHQFPTAAVFSARNRGIDRFIVELERLASNNASQQTDRSCHAHADAWPAPSPPAAQR